jgi:Flp pilus assembly protein TadD
MNIPLSTAHPTRLPLLRAALDDLEHDRLDRAAAACRQLLSIQPDDMQASLLLGLALGGQGQADHAAPFLHRAARDRGTQAHPIHDVTAILCRTGRAGAITAQYRACLRLAPEDVDLRLGFAGHLLAAGQPAEAEAVLARALRLRPDLIEAHMLMGSAQHDLGRMDKAIRHFRRATECAPQAAAGWANLGMVLKIEGRFDEAIVAHDRAVALAPDEPQIRVNRAVALLRAGRMTAAWADYEYRHALPGHAPPLPMQRMLPTLSDLPDLAGRTVLAVHEEGFGDTLQFLRYLPLLAGRGARVVVLAPKELARLLRTVPGIAAVVSDAAELPDYDYHCPFFSLPRAFATTPETIPAAIPYLHADPALTASWAARLGDAKGGLRVGLVWAGQARPWLSGFTTLDRRRSMTLAGFAPLARVPGVRFVSLQKGTPANEAATPPSGLDLHDPMGAAEDFADTAAIIANLDLVISVDTAVVHLAGALGKPVFLLDRYDACWRWLSGRQDSPWYPTLRIFRQQRVGEWGPVMRRVAGALADLRASAT